MITDNSANLPCLMKTVQPKVMFISGELRKKSIYLKTKPVLWLISAMIKRRL